MAESAQDLRCLTSRETAEMLCRESPPRYVLSGVLRTVLSTVVMSGLWYLKGRFPEGLNEWAIPFWGATVCFLYIMIRGSLSVCRGLQHDASTQHNLGLLHLAREEYPEAMFYFLEAANNAFADTVFDQIWERRSTQRCRISKSWT